MPKNNNKYFNAIFKETSNAIGKTDYTRYIIYPSLIIALGVISVAYAAKQAFSISS